MTGEATPTIAPHLLQTCDRSVILMGGGESAAEPDSEAAVLKKK
jgi:hypothetical protein